MKIISIVVIATFFLLTLAGCSVITDAQEVTETKWIGTGISYGKLTVELVPTDNAEADVNYAVELWEKGKLRAKSHVIWSQPELNVHTSK
ncbi:unnamed protein product [marine sediment metagenome]|uniref:Uncharacterized protein n=1 Tax=marine sediment metagenome TaxID=412755 RepID=X0YKS1_9ZZZZ